MHVRHVEYRMLHADCREHFAVRDHVFRAHLAGLQIHGTQGSFLDGAVIAAERVAMLLQDRKFSPHSLRGSKNIAGVGILRDHPQRFLLAAAADHNGRMGAR